MLKCFIILYCMSVKSFSARRFRIQHLSSINTRKIDRYTCFQLFGLACGFLGNVMRYMHIHCDDIITAHRHKQASVGKFESKSIGHVPLPSVSQHVNDKHIKVIHMLCAHEYELRQTYHLKVPSASLFSP